MASAGELFAAALATAETNAFARPAGDIGSAAVLVLGAALAWLLAAQKKLWTPPLLLGFAACYLLLSLLVFETARMALPLTPMLGLTVFVALYRLLGAAAV